MLTDSIRHRVCFGGERAEEGRENSGSLNLEFFPEKISLSIFIFSEFFCWKHTPTLSLTHTPTQSLLLSPVMTLHFVSEQSIMGNLAQGRQLAPYCHGDGMFRFDWTWSRPELVIRFPRSLPRCVQTDTHVSNHQVAPPPPSITSLSQSHYLGKWRSCWWERFWWAAARQTSANFCKKKKQDNVHVGLNLENGWRKGGREGGREYISVQGRS